MGLFQVVSRRKVFFFSAEVKQQPDNSVPQPKPINIPSCSALSLLSDQHTHKLHWQPCWRREINLPIVCVCVRAVAASLTNAIWFDCFVPTRRKTTRRRTKTRWYEVVRQPTFSFPRSLVSSWRGGGGLLFSSTVNKQSSKSGRNSVVLFVCELQVAASLAQKSPDHSRPFSSLGPCYLFTSSTTCSNVSPSSSSLSAVFSPERRSILLCFEVQRVCDALPSIVSGTDTLMLVKLLSRVCWLEGVVCSGQVNYVCLHLAVFFWGHSI